jgi:heavy metal translocating P-type ATPase
VGASGEAGRASWFLAKLGLAAILSGNVMLLQSLLYFGSREALGADVLQTASWIMLVLSVAVYLLLGLPMLGIALRAARHGRFVLESLIGLGALAALVVSAAATLEGAPKTYYDSGTMVLVFVVLGQYLDARWRQKAVEALPAVVARARRQARVVRGGGEIEVPPQEVEAGEQVRVLAGEEIPVDGRVVLGATDVHEPALTGESVPRLVGVGDHVHAGTIARDGTLVVEASGSAELLEERIERFVREARSRRSPLERLADRYASLFVQGVLVVSVASLLFWGAAEGDWGRGALASLAVLVVACPCALGIATPMATTIALARAAGRGTLLRRPAALQLLARVRKVAFDKTGTLTQGHPVVEGLRLVGSGEMVESEVLRLAAAVERGVDHPFARAVVAEAGRRGLVVPPSTDARSIPGGGAEGSVAGRHVRLGGDAVLAGLLPREPATSEHSRVGVVVDGTAVGEIYLRDPPRAEARDAVAHLEALGVGSMVLSGDRVGPVAAVAREVGLTSALGGLSPEAKRGEIERLVRGGMGVAMVGDGTNDAAALAAATVGIAFGAPTDLARREADVVILKEDLREVPDLIALAGRTLRIVKENLVWAFAYNAVGIALAAAGVLTPVIAAGAMVLSSLFVVGNSLRLR